ncbi:MAG: glycosyltransferase family 2 protein [Clostridia bacterium]|nr:glycosyltransferase family 2 protein [Clostridia bacterium]
MDLSIIIVNYNTKALTTQTVKSVIDSTSGIDYEIIVVDNSSKTNEYFDMEDKCVKILSGVENKGFGHACNIGANIAIGRYILFLNSDVIMKRNTLKCSVEYMDKHGDIGCLGIKTFLKDGSFDHGCKRGFPTPFNSLCYVLKLDRLFPKVKKFGGYTLNYLSKDETNEVDSVSGAFMLIPKRVIGKVGLFDESIFMYGEDIDLCYRIKRAGFKVVYYADVSMTHLKGQSGLHTKSPLVIKHFHDGIKRFYDMYYRDKHNAAVTFLMHSAINIRYVIALAASKIRG